MDIPRFNVPTFYVLRDITFWSSVKHRNTPRLLRKNMTSKVDNAFLIGSSAGKVDCRTTCYTNNYTQKEYLSNYDSKNFKYVLKTYLTSILVKVEFVTLIALCFAYEITERSCVGETSEEQLQAYVREEYDIAVQRKRLLLAIGQIQYQKNIMQHQKYIDRRTEDNVITQKYLSGRSKVLRYYNNSTPGGRASSVPQTLDFRNQRFDTTGMPASIPQHLWDMRREENRWQSFHLPDASFTASQLVSVTDLAADGFFYLQESDRVKCAFCKGVLKDWEAGEQVREAHRRHFSTCPFVLSVEVGNVPREHREAEGELRTAVMVEAVQCSEQTADEAAVIVSGDWSMKTVPELPPMEGTAVMLEWAMAKDRQSRTAAISGRDEEVIAAELMRRPYVPVSSEAARSACSERALTNLSALQHSLETEPASVTAKQPQFESFQARCESLRSALAQQPVYLLAKAGFFYSEAERATCCFSCGLRINEWSCDDDVWVEHARWSPRCPHVLMERSCEFVQAVHRLLPPVKLESAASSGAAAAAAGGHSGTARSTRTDEALAVTPGVEFRVEARDIRARSDLPVVRLLTQLGFSALQVRLLTELHLRQRGDDFETSEQFLDFMLNESRRMRKQSQDPETYFESRMSQIREPLNQQPRPRDLNDWKTCKVCMDKEVNIMLLDCGHVACCSVCAKSLKTCPICRAFIRGSLVVKYL